MKSEVEVKAMYSAALEQWATVAVHGMMAPDMAFGRVTALADVLDLSMDDVGDHLEYWRRKVAEGGVTHDAQARDAVSDA